MWLQFAKQVFTELHSARTRSSAERCPGIVRKVDQSTNQHMRSVQESAAGQGENYPKILENSASHRTRNSAWSHQPD